MTKNLINLVTYSGYLLIGFFCMVLLFFTFERTQHTERIQRNTFLAGIDVSSLKEEAFSAKMEVLQAELEEKVINLAYEEERIAVRPPDLGLVINEQELWDTIITTQTKGSYLEELLYWGERFVTPTQFEMTTLVDMGVLARSLDAWELLVPEIPAQEGSIGIIGFSIKREDPQEGSRLDKERLGNEIIHTMLSKPHQYTMKVPLVAIPPVRGIEEYDDIEYRIRTFLSAPIEVYAPKYGGHSHTLNTVDLAELVSVGVPVNPNLGMSIQLNTDLLKRKLISLSPKEARFVVADDFTVSIEPSRDGFDIGLDETKNAIIEAGTRSSRRRALLDARSYVVPEFTTEDAEALKIDHLVSRFTTYHGCCQDRVQNIHLVADLVDGMYVQPGETVSMNEFLGERTAARGFKNAGTIIEGRLEESIGGGISQFMTTFHNAVYWGGYAIVEHKSHSIYFSRYPVGIEATINWPWVDYRFKNDTDTGIYIEADYTDTSITISFYGSNHGRMAIGDHKGGVTDVQVTGGTDASRIVISEVSPRYNILDPLIEYIPDETLARGEEVVESVGDPRWSVNVNRVVKEGETLIHSNFWPVHYQQEQSVIRKHPCDFYVEGFDYSTCVSGE